MSEIQKGSSGRSNGRNGRGNARSSSQTRKLPPRTGAEPSIIERTQALLRTRDQRDAVAESAGSAVVSAVRSEMNGRSSATDSAPYKRPFANAQAAAIEAGKKLGSAAMPMSLPVGEAFRNTMHPLVQRALHDLTGMGVPRMRRPNIPS